MTKEMVLKKLYGQGIRPKQVIKNARLLSDFEKFAKRLHETMEDKNIETIPVSNPDLNEISLGCYKDDAGAYHFAAKEKSLMIKYKSGANWSLSFQNLEKSNTLYHLAVSSKRTNERKRAFKFNAPSGRCDYEYTENSFNGMQNKSDFPFASIDEENRQLQESVAIAKEIFIDLYGNDLNQNEFNYIMYGTKPPSRFSNFNL